MQAVEKALGRSAQTSLRNSRGDSDKEDEASGDDTPIQEKIAWLKQQLSELKTLDGSNTLPDKTASKCQYGNEPAGAGL